MVARTTLYMGGASARRGDLHGNLGGVWRQRHLCRSARDGGAADGKSDLPVRRDPRLDEGSAPITPLRSKLGSRRHRSAFGYNALRHSSSSRRPHPMSRWNLAWLVGIPLVVLLGLTLTYSAPPLREGPELRTGQAARRRARRSRSELRPRTRPRAAARARRGHDQRRPGAARPAFRRS